MILTTTETISGKNLATLGLVQGNTIQSKHMFSDMGQSFKTMVGGELKSYTEMMNKARDIATQRMIDMAARMGQTLLYAFVTHQLLLCNRLPKCLLTAQQLNLFKTVKP